MITAAIIATDAQLARRSPSAEAPIADRSCAGMIPSPAARGGSPTTSWRPRKPADERRGGTGTGGRGLEGDHRPLPPAARLWRAPRSAGRGPGNGADGEARPPRPQSHEQPRGGLTLAGHLASEVQKPRFTEALRSDLIATAVQALARAEELWVVGFGDNYPLAHMARALLIQVRPDIRMIPSAGSRSRRSRLDLRRRRAAGARRGRRTRALRSVMRSAVRSGARCSTSPTGRARLSGGRRGDAALSNRRGGDPFWSSPRSVCSPSCSTALQIGEAAIERLKRIEGSTPIGATLLTGDL